MVELLETMSSEWAIRALIASSLVGIMCGMIGSFIVLRNMALIGDALAHAILPGIFIAFVILGYSTIGFFIGSVLAGLIAAVGITWIQHNVKTKNDAAIGIVFTAMFSLGVIGISWISREQGVHLDLKDFLFGSVLGISNEDIYLTAVITVFCILSVVVFYRYLFITTFQPTIAQTMGISVKFVHYYLMLLLSFAVVAALRTVGVILVVAMLITPAATALLLSDKLKNVVIISSILGLLSAFFGLIFSIVFETTPGPAMAVTATVIYFIAVIFAPKKGLLVRSIRKSRQKSKIEKEDILRQAIKFGNGTDITLDLILERLSFGRSQLLRHLNKLGKDGLVATSNNHFNLTTEGISKANELVRAHRLWETYLVDNLGLTESQIHEDADKYEHLLTDEILDEVDMQLGYPTVDPHGSPIPPKKVKTIYLNAMTNAAKAIIAKEQPSDEVESRLWELGILPKSELTLLEKSDLGYIIKSGKKRITIPVELAEKVVINNLQK